MDLKLGGNRPEIEIFYANKSGNIVHPTIYVYIDGERHILNFSSNIFNSELMNKPNIYFRSHETIPNLVLHFKNSNNCGVIISKDLTPIRFKSYSVKVSNL